MGFLDLLLSRQNTGHTGPNPEATDLRNVVQLTDHVYELLYHRSYAERCDRDGLPSCRAWLHAQIDELGVDRIHHERLVILAKFRNGDRSRSDLPKA
jgi:hypothetical protein